MNIDSSIILASVAIITFLTMAVKCESAKKEYIQSVKDKRDLERVEHIDALLRLYRILRAVRLVGEICPTVLASNDENTILGGLYSESMNTLVDIAVEFYLNGDVSMAVEMIKAHKRIAGHGEINNSAAISVLEDTVNNRKELDSAYAVKPILTKPAKGRK